MSTIEFVSVRGGPVSVKPQLQKRRPTSGRPEEWHRGFVVEGLAPGSLQKARTAICDARAEWLGLDDTERAKRLRSGEREPKQWDEAKWRNSAKRTRIAKPFGVPEAADQCKALAERSGWIEVRIVELAKRKG